MTHSSPFPLLAVFSGLYSLIAGFGVLGRSTGSNSISEQPIGKITFMSMRDSNFEIYTISATGENATNLTRNPALDYWASYSPSGENIYFYSKRDGRDQLYRMDADGKHQVSVSPSSFNDRLPTVSPDGNSIVFLSDRDTQEGELYIMNTDGSDVKRLTHNVVAEDVATWSPNGKKIIYARDARSKEEIASEMEGDFELFSLRHDGLKEKKLTQFPGFCAAPVYSPDGKRIAFYGRGDGGVLDIYTMKPNGSDIKNITLDTLEDYSPSWSPDGKWIAYTSGDISNYDIWIVHLQSGRKARLTMQAKRDETPIWTR